MNETYIQTVRGGIQHVIHLAKDHWTQTPKPYGFYYHHELYGYIPVSKLSELIRDAWDETYMGWEEYTWLCYENRYLTLEQMAAQMLECGSYMKFSTPLYELLSRSPRWKRITPSQKCSLTLTAPSTKPADKAKER